MMKRVLLVILLLAAIVLFGGCHKRGYVGVEQVSENVTRYYRDAIVLENGTVLFERVATVEDYPVGH